MQVLQGEKFDSIESSNGGAITNSDSDWMIIGNNAQFIGNAAEYAGTILNQRSDLKQNCPKQIFERIVI